MSPALRATQRHRHRSLALAGATVLLPFALSLALSFAVTPEQIESGEVVVAPTCTWKRVFGRPCPTCGLTRGFAALSHGRLDDATHYNRGVLFVYALWWLGTVGSAVVTLRHVRRYLRLANPPADRSPETCS